MSTQELISQLQRERKAVIYIRQSTPHQVLTNQESLKLQYALKERAQELGWLEHTIEVIDCDLGMSGATATAREGFKELVAEVTLGQVGIILSSEVTRLSRNCSDWYQLLDVCAVKDCLIGDRDGVYDPRTPNGRLLLGLKGQLSEMELFAIRARLTAGLLNKARRGDLVQRLPVGLIREPDGMVTKDPDREVQARLLLVFETYAARGSVSKVVRHFHRHALLVPRRDTFGILVWNRANNESVQAILRNPAYAGMFVYGRTGIPQGYAARKPLPMEQWKIVVEDRYPAYISREQYEKVQKMLKDNYAEYTKRQSRGVSRSGTALLQGIVYCGVCGHKMTMQYKGGARYVCNALQVQNCAPLCQHILADAVDAQVVGAFFEVLSPAELNLYAEAVKEELTRSEKLQMAQRQQCERLRYQASSTRSTQRTAWSQRNSRNAGILLSRSSLRQKKNMRPLYSVKTLPFLFHKKSTLPSRISAQSYLGSGMKKTHCRRSTRKIFFARSSTRWCCIEIRLIRSTYELCGAVATSQHSPSPSQSAPLRGSQALTKWSSLLSSTLGRENPTEKLPTLSPNGDIVHHTTYPS